MALPFVGAIAGSIVIAPLLALYIKFKTAQYALKLFLFGMLYLLFKNGIEWAISTVMARMDGMTFPCMTSYILTSLGVFEMINFALSFYATMYIGRFVYGSIVKLIP